MAIGIPTWNAYASLWWENCLCLKTYHISLHVHRIINMYEEFAGVHFEKQNHQSIQICIIMPLWVFNITTHLEIF